MRFACEVDDTQGDDEEEELVEDKTNEESGESKNSSI